MQQPRNSPATAVAGSLSQWRWYSAVRGLLDPCNSPATALQQQLQALYHSDGDTVQCVVSSIPATAPQQPCNSSCRLSITVTVMQCSAWSPRSLQQPRNSPATALQQQLQALYHSDGDAVACVVSSIPATALQQPCNSPATSSITVTVMQWSAWSPRSLQQPCNVLYHSDGDAVECVVSSIPATALQRLVSQWRWCSGVRGLLDCQASAPRRPILRDITLNRDSFTRPALIYRTTQWHCIYPVLYAVTLYPVLYAVTLYPVLYAVTLYPVLYAVTLYPVLYAVTLYPVLCAVTLCPILYAVTLYPILYAVTLYPILYAVTLCPIYCTQWHCALYTVRSDTVPYTVRSVEEFVPLQVNPLITLQ